jgi:hypothetical protein
LRPRLPLSIGGTRRYGKLTWFLRNPLIGRVSKNHFGGAGAVCAHDRLVAAVATTVAAKGVHDAAASVDKAMLLHYVDKATRVR